MATFGGPWTEKKLECVSSYLSAYQTALKNQKFRLVYIDAFCGDGSVNLKGENAPLLKESRDFTLGSAWRALELEPPFHAYHFIDRSPKSLEKLRNLLLARRKNLIERVSIHAGDVNDVLPNIVQKLDIRKDRAVVFADPFGMQLNWETVEQVSACPVIDFWYLVPTGAINRLITRSGIMPDRWGDKLDKFLGTPTWRQRSYRESPQADLFKEAAGIEKAVGLDEIEKDFQLRLKSAFAKVAPNMLRLTHKGKVLFTLMFACSNPRPKANNLAVKIADHLLRG